jgi:hypothetical protein
MIVYPAVAVGVCIPLTLVLSLAFYVRNVKEYGAGHNVSICELV